MSFRQTNGTFSSDPGIIDSLNSDASRRLFSGLSERRPTLEMALREAQIKDPDIILDDSCIYAKSARENPEIAKLGLSDDEACAISCYTLEGTDDLRTPYKVINEGLAGSRNRRTLTTSKRLLFLLLSGLRKLPRVKTSPGQIFYRGIRAKVPRTKGEANGHQYYENGKTVTWWGFTSTTTSIKVARNFIKGAPESTLFNIGGEDLWGYDISAFSQVPNENEILLEPEAKVLVKGSVKRGTFLMIDVTLQPFKHLVLEDVIPVENTKSISVSELIVVQGSTEMKVERNDSDDSPLIIESRESQVIDQERVAEKKKEGKWSCAWKECPDNTDEGKKYSVGGENLRTATKINDDWKEYCTIIGNTPIPFNTLTSWSINVLKTKDNDCGSIYIGVAPFDVNQNDRCYKRGWYLDCFRSILSFGPPYDNNYPGKSYGPNKGWGQYVRTRGNVGVVMDTTKGELSFALNGVNYGVAYEEIPLDKPLAPCVVLGYKDDSVELDISEVNEAADNSVLVPPNIMATSGTCDSIILTWDNVEDASFYQIEVDGSKFWDASTTNSFTKRGLLSETEHCFKVRTTRGSSVSEWSGAVKGRTLKAPEFSECVWRKCPDDVDDNRKYIADEKNPRVATKINSSGYYCTIIGNTHIPFNTVASWSIKILESKNNDGAGIYIGVAPFDINQSNDDNQYNCGWYFNYYNPSLYSGPPHKYNGKEYGPRKEGGQYVRLRDSVGVVMDTSNRELSFILNDVNYSTAYKDIPLDKPLVPCVLLYYKGDSVELI